MIKVESRLKRLGFKSLLLVLGLGLSLTVSQVVSAKSVIFQDDFENIAHRDYPNEHGWKILFGGKSAYVCCETKSFRLEGYSDWARMDYIRSVSLPDKLSYEANVYILNSSEGRGAIVGFMEDLGNMGPTFNAIRFRKNGNITFDGPQVTIIRPWLEQNVYNVKVDIDFINEVADVYIDGVLEAANIIAYPKEFDSASWGHVVLTKWGFSTGNFPGSGTNIVYFDDVIILGPDVSGFISLKWLPLEGRKVILRQIDEIDQTTKTDAKGYYEFENIVSGKEFNVIIDSLIVP